MFSSHSLSSKHDYKENGSEGLTLSENVAENVRMCAENVAENPAEVLPPPLGFPVSTSESYPPDIMF